MKKIALFFALSAIVFASCATKETPDQVIPKETGSHATIFATMPEFQMTKATIDVDGEDAGKFAWEENDYIKVVYTNGSATPWYTFKCTDPATGKFESVDEIPEGYHLQTVGTIAYYPSEYYGVALTSIGSVDYARKAFQMKATYNSTNGHVEFAHQSALMKVVVKNVPCVANKLVVNGVTVTLSGLTNPVESTLTAYVPIEPGKKPAYLAIKKDDALIVNLQSAKEVDVQAGTLYTSIPQYTVTPTSIHFLSGKTISGSSWTPNDNNIVSGGSKTGFSVLQDQDKWKWFRYAVKYKDVVVDYGYSSGQAYDATKPFYANGTQSASIGTPGVYSITFNYLTGAYTVTKTSDNPLYLIGINGDWTWTNFANPLVNVYDNVYAWTGTTSSDEVKAFEYGETGWTDYTYGNKDGSLSSGNYSPGNISLTEGSDAKVVILDFDRWKFSTGLVTNAASSVTLVGGFTYTDSNGDHTGAWNVATGVSLTQDATYKRLWKVENLVIKTQGACKFMEGSSWYGYSQAGTTLSNGTTYELIEGYTGIDMTLPAGTYTLIYNDILHTVLVKKTAD